MKLETQNVRNLEAPANLPSSCTQGWPGNQQSPVSLPCFLSHELLYCRCTRRAADSLVGKSSSTGSLIRSEHQKFTDVFLGGRWRASHRHRAILRKSRKCHFGKFRPHQFGEVLGVCPPPSRLSWDGDPAYKVVSSNWLSEKLRTFRVGGPRLCILSSTIVLFKLNTWTCLFSCFHDLKHFTCAATQLFCPPHCETVEIVQMCPVLCATASTFFAHCSRWRALCFLYLKCKDQSFSDAKNDSDWRDKSFTVSKVFERFR